MVVMYNEKEDITYLVTVLDYKFMIATEGTDLSIILDS